MATATVPSVGPLLRAWRQRRRLSQLDLALEAGVSTRHVSFVETGRAQPSREMVLHLAEQLEVPLRERNALLLAAGFAPVYRERDLDAPDMAPLRAALDVILAGHEPYPALVVDRRWNLLAGTSAVALLTAGVAPELLAPPANVLRIALHPDGMAPNVLNGAEWREHLLDRLARQVAHTGDDELAALLEELVAYPAPAGTAPGVDPAGEIVVPLRVRTEIGDLAFFSTVAAFGTAVDVTVSELGIESFFPADAATADALRARAAAG
jgi:transcriptional regulator with XRE-family HTH domain